MNKIFTISVIALAAGATELQGRRSHRHHHSRMGQLEEIERVPPPVSDRRRPMGVSPPVSDRRRPTGLGQLGEVEHVPSQDFCERGFIFDQDACACFSEI